MQTGHALTYINTNINIVMTGLRVISAVRGACLALSSMDRTAIIWLVGTYLKSHYSFAGPF